MWDFFMAKKYIFTSESVCEGHPDKVCDRISDAVLDAALDKDPYSRVALETLVTTNLCVLAGELTTNSKLDYEKIARDEIRYLGYTHPEWGFSDTCDVKVYVHTQSKEIAQGVDQEGAGDQGIMFGYACDETSSLMPLPIDLAHRLAEAIDGARKDKTIPYFRPDGKTQVTVEYKDGKPYKVTDVVLAIPHDESVSLEDVKSDAYEKIVKVILDKYGFSINKDKVILNGTGSWHIGGPAADTGVTGRKIVVDSYGGYARVGGGCFSGKDPTKVDRSGAYAARYIAKQIVKEKLASKVELRLAYFIGAKEPLMAEIETFGTEKTSEKAIKDYASKLLNPQVSEIIKKFDLRRPIYKQTSAYGHFGREEFPWEKTE